MASNAEFGKETTSEQLVDFSRLKFEAKPVRGFTHSSLTYVLTCLRTVVITGVSLNDVGEALTRAITFKDPSQLIVTARSVNKATLVVQKFSVDFPSVSMKIIQMELSSLSSVRQATSEIQTSTESIDI